MIHEFTLETEPSTKMLTQSKRNAKMSVRDGTGIEIRTSPKEFSRNPKLVLCKLFVQPSMFTMNCQTKFTHVEWQRFHMRK